MLSSPSPKDLDPLRRQGAARFVQRTPGVDRPPEVVLHPRLLEWDPGTKKLLPGSPAKLAGPTFLPILANGY